ncbi:MAG: RHS repeat-associated core domain-containing protein [Petrimonas sp.]|nr:RHS repeat-associated core domain-containing protein [Petrimonas sp.]
MYDATLGRFLSPDPYVQNPLMTQNYNRCSYGVNNPLVYIDESGSGFLPLFFLALEHTLILFYGVLL